MEVNSRVNAARRAAGEAELDRELAIEATYQFELMPGWLLQPDMQCILHPGGQCGADAALVGGVRVTFSF